MIEEQFICIVTGDYSLDGHEKYDNTYIKSNISKSEMEKAYAKACEMVGFNFIKYYCREYGECVLPTDIVEKLLKVFPEIKTYFDEDKNDINDSLEDDFSINCFLELWINIYLLMIKHIIPNFEYEFLSNSVEKIYIGGYGLYY